MSLRERQSIFARNVARLIEWCFREGYEVTFGEGYVSSGKGHMANSLHYERLAIDLNLFRDGEYLTDSADYRRAGEAWKQLHEMNRWGGDFRFPDGNHFSMSVGDHFYWQYWPFKVLQVNSIKVVNTDKKVKAGEMMLYEVSFDKYLDMPCSIQRQLVNSYKVDYAPLFPPRKVTGVGIKSISSIHVPSYVDPGTWYMLWTAECRVTGNRVISYTYESERFEVTK